MTLPTDKVDRAIFRKRVDRLLELRYLVKIRGYLVVTDAGLRCLMAHADEPIAKPNRKPEAV